MYINLEKFLFLLMGSLIAVMIWALVVSVNEDHAFKASCDAKGGVVIESDDHNYCVKADSFLL